jgi:hypothetical protein
VTAVTCPFTSSDSAAQEETGRSGECKQTECAGFRRGGGVYGADYLFSGYRTAQLDSVRVIYEHHIMSDVATACRSVKTEIVVALPYSGALKQIEAEYAEIKEQLGGCSAERVSLDIRRRVIAA